MQFTLGVALVLVVLVIFVFLRNLSATLIPSLAMPLSIMGTFTVMYLASFSMDNLSLMALTLSLGFVVDDAIVMLENVVRHMEMGKKHDCRRAGPILKEKADGGPGHEGVSIEPPLIRIGGGFTKSQYQFALQSPDTKELYHYASILEDRMRSMESLIDVSSDLQLKNPEVRVWIDRDKASALGVTAEQVEDALYSAYGLRQISTIYAPNNSYQGILELLPEYQRDAAALSILYVRSSSGQLVPLETLAKFSQGLGPISVNHSGQLPSVTISFDLKPGVALGQAVSEIQKLARSLLPATITTSFQGAAQAFQSSMEGLGLLLVMAMLVIYLVLGILYESFIHPITILSALPFAGFGALATLLFFKTELNIYFFVGIIMLVGLVKKNGIIMIDFAIEAQREGGKAPVEAIDEACMIRFRPVMMTPWPP